MSPSHPAEPELYSIEEVARAAGVAPVEVRALIAADDAASISSDFLSFDEAVRVVRDVHEGALPHTRRLLAPGPVVTRRRGAPLALSGAVHAVLLVAILVVTGASGSTTASEATVPDSPRLVFLITPGPGGGGGGGGLRQPAPPPPARLHGPRPVSSPVTVARRTDSREREEILASKPESPVPALVEVDPHRDPPPAAPPVHAPVVSIAADEEDQAGVVTETPATQPSHGPGQAGGVGTGQGDGIGEGDGEGIGAGSTAGAGGGPYRPGSGITPPALLREVKPLYTEEARRRGLEGDVLLEAVVGADGSVGAVRIVRGLGAGLDARAVEAVRQWRFSPARRLGTPVDVLVEIAVEFRLR